MSNVQAEVNASSTMPEYYHWVDIAKGLGVILVLLGHMLYITTFDTLNQVIYSFHVPMYFALSGMLLKSSSKGFWQYTWEKALRILIPAYALQILLTGLRVVIWRDVAFDTEFWLKLAYWDGAPKWNEPTWFFICMFGVCLLQKIIHLPEMSMDWRIAVMLMSIVLGYVFVTYELHYFGAANFLICFSSFILGSVLMHIIQTYPRQYFKWILLGALLVWGVTAFRNPKISLFYHVYADYWLLIIAAVAGTIASILLSYFTPASRICTFLSYNTVFIMLSHYFFVWIYKSIILHYHLEKTEDANCWCLVTLVVMLALYYPLCRAINRWCPFLNGRAKALKSSLVS